MAHPSQDSAKAELIGTFLEALTYGYYLVVFGKCIRILRAKHTEGRPTVIMTCTALIIFVLVTIHFAMDLLRSFNAFTSHMDVANYPVTYYTIVRRDLDLIKSAAYIAMTSVSDGLIGYRTFVVWGRHKVLAAFLLVLLIADIALGTYAVDLLALTQPGQDALAGRVTDRVSWFYAVTLAYNVLCTSLISVKIWQVQRAVDRYAPAVSVLLPRRFRAGSKLMLVVVESAAIYSFFLTLLIAMSVMGAPGMLAMLDLIAPVIGTVFSMVIIRVSVDRTRWDSIKISTILNFGISSTSSAPTHTAGSVSGQRRGSHGRLKDEGDCVKAAGCDLEDQGEGGVPLNKLDNPRLRLGLDVIEEIGFAAVPAHGYHSSSSRRERKQKVDLSLNDSGFHSVCEEDMEASGRETRCGCVRCGGLTEAGHVGVGTGRWSTTPGIAVSLPVSTPAVLLTPTDDETLPLPLPTYLHSPLHSHPYSHGYPYRYMHTRQPSPGMEEQRAPSRVTAVNAGIGLQAISMGMFSASRSSVHLPLPGI